jgi:exonuclease SbcD
MIRILHTSELLLDFAFADNDELADLRRADQLKTFEKLINLAIKNEADLMVIAGNLFATPRPESEIVEIVGSGLQRLVDRQIIPVILPGSLDGVPTPDNIFRLSSLPGLVLGDLRRLRRPLSLELKSSILHLYGFAWGADDGDPASLSSMRRLDQPGFHLGILQACAGGDERTQYFRPLPVVDPGMLQQWGLDYVALGNRRNWREIGNDDAVLASFAGTPEGLSFQETGPRYAALVTLGDGSTKIEKLPVNTRTLEKSEFDLSRFESTEAIAGAIAEHAHPEVVFRAILKGEPAVFPDLTKLRELLAERFAGLDIEDCSVLFDGEFAETLRTRGGPGARLLEETVSLRSEAADDKDRRLLESAFRTALAHLEGATEDRS